MPALSPARSARPPGAGWTLKTGTTSVAPSGTRTAHEGRTPSRSPAMSTGAGADTGLPAARNRGRNATMTPLLVRTSAEAAIHTAPSGTRTCAPTALGASTDAPTVTARNADDWRGDPPQGAGSADAATVAPPAPVHPLAPRVNPGFKHKFTRGISGSSLTVACGAPGLRR